MTPTRRMIMLALCVAVAGILHVVESGLPVLLPVPGAKLGLANMVSLFVLAAYGWRDALYVAGLRVVLGSLLGGGLLGPSFVMAMSGALVSILVMTWGRRLERPAFSLVGISILGAAAHNVAQIVVAAALVASYGLFWYLPYLLLLAVPTGFFTGYGVASFLTRMPVGKEPFVH